MLREVIEFLYHNIANFLLEISRLLRVQLLLGLEHEDLINLRLEFGKNFFLIENE